MAQDAIEIDHDRMGAWLAFKRWDYKDLAKAMGCNRSYVWGVLKGQRRPGAKFLS